MRGTLKKLTVLSVKFFIYEDFLETSMNNLKNTLNHNIIKLKYYNFKTVSFTYKNKTKNR